MSEARPPITAVLLAGGQGRRLGGVDKGLVSLAGRTLAERVIERVAPDVEALVINANRNPERWAALGYPLVTDIFPGSAGPLAGFHAGLVNAETPLVMMVPCDTPRLPFRLASTLWSRMQAEGADIVHARDHLRHHPVIALMRRELADDLSHCLAGGERRIDRWYARHHGHACLFDDAEAFVNINTPEDRDAFIEREASRA
ncbi:molybdenum cofactor guanylyltransferase MobA [Kushneria aurantia]|uniref:Molybdenum cofactor guanylyltransferase n=1 Tax=Kushneria aurantia TaxID=504092 RepID=A0ABV6G190_9GAMM|nr:molybdenum cofactor guanylyltransferase MobA [Kushneria aurantia]